MAFEFTGSAENAELRRPEDDGHTPDLSLAYYGTSDWRIGEEFWPGEWVARTRQSGGTGVANWAFRRVFSDNDKFLRLAPGDDMLSVPEDMRPKVGKPNAPVIRTDYLMVTRIPNFLSVNFSNQVNSDAKKLPYLLIFDGLTGLGTRALEPLLADDGMAALHNAKRYLNDASCFQVIFRAHGIYRDAGFHRTDLIDYEESQGLPEDPKYYDKSHKKLMQRGVIQ